MIKNVMLLFGLTFTLVVNGQVGLDENIRKRSEALSSGFEVFVVEEKLHCVKLLPEFYQLRLFKPAWDNHDIKTFISILDKADEEGLNQEDYHFKSIQYFLNRNNTSEEKAELDMLLTDAFLLYASHFLNGKVNPETVDSEWKAVRREGNAREFMEKALSENNIANALQNLLPGHIGYNGLKESLKRYKEIAENGGWASIPAGETIKPGMTDSIRIPLLIKRLIVTNDLTSTPDDQYTYSETIQQAVTNYQTRNGLESDGNLGKLTVASLNTPVGDLIDQIKINMERYRWISQDLGDHYVIVNIADYRMEVYKNNQMTFNQKVIVGKPFRKTPVFSSKMTYFVLNPYWTVPPTILFNDILPELQKNSGYLATKNIRLFQGQGSSSTEVDPLTVNWSNLSKNNFPYTLRQDPGATNALGIVKFMFPNKYNIYIHDTPSKELFNRQDRAFSSGCIRLNKPMEFANYLIQNEPGWNTERMTTALNTGKEQTIILTKPLNVHILYLTTWWQDGMVHFRKDLYNRDQAVLSALNEPTPIL
ncbi:L,D-transpeptidase family protein [Reichenbachiella sp. MALMAid0571]|uniref:L,D-transpeptidase family protein n=1 Tax=Reichenbachiella sp. MALMAid0571 TaxID=3143939 RepID=UPI0032DE3B01